MRWLLLTTLLVVVNPLSSAFAQSTGGSFGGGDWGSSDSYGGGGSYDYGGSDSYDSSSIDDSSSDPSSDDWGSDDDSGGGSMSGSEFLAWLVFLAGLGLLYLMTGIGGELWRGFRGWYGRLGGGASVRAGSAGRGWNGVDVTALSLAIDWNGRVHLQAELERMARTGSTKTSRGRAELLHETAKLLEAAQNSWLYWDIQNHQPMNQSIAQGIFRRLTVDARARFQKDVIRDERGSLMTDDPGALTAKPHEGPGVVVVTLVVAARKYLPDVYAVDPTGNITRLLWSLLTTTEQQLIALEVIWSPAVEEDRMSTAELTALYPNLRRFDERSVGGRVFCKHCTAPYADEQPACPHCGAPNEREAEGRP